MPARLSTRRIALDDRRSSGRFGTYPTYRGAVTVISLSDVAALQASATFGENLGTSPRDETLAGTAGGMLLGAAVDNTFGASANAPTLSGGIFDTNTLSLGADFITGGSSAGIVQAYGVIDTTGNLTATFTPGTSGGDSSRNAGAYLTVVAVPEPTSALSGGLCLFGLLHRRRTA